MKVESDIEREGRVGFGVCLRICWLLGEVYNKQHTRSLSVSESENVMYMYVLFFFLHT